MGQAVVLTVQISGNLI